LSDEKGDDLKTNRPTDTIDSRSRLFERGSVFFALKTQNLDSAWQDLKTSTGSQAAALKKNHHKQQTHHVPPVVEARLAVRLAPGMVGRKIQLHVSTSQLIMTVSTQVRHVGQVPVYRLPRLRRRKKSSSS